MANIEGYVDYNDAGHVSRRFTEARRVLHVVNVVHDAAGTIMIHQARMATPPLKQRGPRKTVVNALSDVAAIIIITITITMRQASPRKSSLSVQGGTKFMWPTRSVQTPTVSACWQGLTPQLSTFWLQVSAFCGVGGAFRGCLMGVWKVLRRYQGVSRV